MNYLDQLSDRARPSLTRYVDQFVRNDLGHIYSDYSGEDVNKIIKKVYNKYLHLGNEQEKYKEINDAFLSSPLFIEDLKSYIVDFLENRPTLDRVEYYRSLIATHNLLDKKNINRDKLEERISVLESTQGTSQDF
ncbi:hypothetical protein MKX40_22305 [Paenibacillus sp. FSL R5-0517]|uniref:hypothetical protein n=1 Tax=Paenibacillus sp. FSL R5-0517 TaxID=2921647 RepID=UPI0030DA7596